MKNKTSSLRKRAEEFLNKHPEVIKEIASVDVKKLVEDLHVHQIELEIQNEELRRAQLELEASRDKYSDLYDFAPVGYVTVSEKGLILQANLSCAAMLGIERSSLIRKPFSRFITKDDQDVFYLHQKKLFETKTKQTCELKLIRKDRSQFYAQLESIVVKDAKGGIPQTRTIITDINNRKLAEEALRESEETARMRLAEIETIYSNAPVGLCVLDTKLRFVRINNRLAEINGVPAEEHIGRTVREIVPDLADQVESEMRRIIETGEPVYGIETTGETAAQPGVIRTWIVNRLPLRQADGTVIGLNIVAQDITTRKRGQEALRKAHDELDRQVKERTAQLTETNKELKQEIEDRKLAEKAVRKSQERYMLAVSGATDGIWDWDILSNTVFYSGRFKENLGYASEEFPETVDAFRSRLHPEDADAVWAAVERHLQEHVPYNIEYRLKTKSGEYRWFLARGQAIWDDKGNATRMAGSIKNITERMEAAQNLQDAFAEIKKLKNHLEAEKAYLQEEIKLEYNFENIIGNSDELRYTLYKVEQIAQTDTAVIILGETGTGKELIARAIHGSSPRKNRALVKVNCATLPFNLMESELFGYEKGAFTGAFDRRLGRFEVADGATLFLDEIGELPLELQAKLLRVIQDGEFERLGSSRTLKVDVRIIAATNRNLEEEVHNGRFRKDLWYRLNIFPITVPPLRNRKQDLPLLVDFFVDRVSRKLGKSIDTIPKSVMDALQNYHWPGNVRELANVIERAVINASGNKLRLMDTLDTPQKHLATTPKTLETVERDHIIRILEETRWKVAGKNGASEILGLNSSTLRARMRKLGIRKP
jgi:PAS domain S-box-containing protein